MAISGDFEGRWGPHHRGQIRPYPTGWPERVDLEMSELEAILERAKAALSQDEYDTLHAAMETLNFLTQELEKKHVSIQWLKQMLFGAATESTCKVMEKILDETERENKPGEEDKQGKSPPESSSKANGHGRNGTDAYPGAETVRVPHDPLNPGDPCPKRRRLWDSSRPDYPHPRPSPSGGYGV